MIEEARGVEGEDPATSQRRTKIRLFLDRNLQICSELS
jgi:hypothetical protein